MIRAGNYKIIGASVFSIFLGDRTKLAWKRDAAVSGITDTLSVVWHVAAWVYDSLYQGGMAFCSFSIEAHRGFWRQSCIRPA